MPISVLNPNCDPMVYPILFPNGEKGWDEEMKSEKQAIRNRNTLLQFYSYRLAIRDEFNPILNVGKLSQQYIVDAYVKIEGNRLYYIRMNQQNLRIENYRGLTDHVHNMTETERWENVYIAIIFFGKSACNAAKLSGRYVNCP
jgi:hypothetical protein